MTIDPETTYGSPIEFSRQWGDEKAFEDPKPLWFDTILYMMNIGDVVSRRSINNCRQGWIDIFGSEEALEQFIFDVFMVSKCDHFLSKKRGIKTWLDLFISRPRIFEAALMQQAAAFFKDLDYFSSRDGYDIPQEHRPAMALLSLCTDDSNGPIRYYQEDWSKDMVRTIELMRSGISRAHLSVALETGMDAELMGSLLVDSRY